MLRKWKLIASLGLTAAGAAAAGIAVLLQKLPKEAPQEGSAAPAAKPKTLRTGVYSFISGFQDAATVELSLDYDPEIFSFAIVEDEFLNYSGDSHVAILYGTEFNLQLEYASYYDGEGFEAHAAALRARYQTRGDFACGALAGLWVLDGDNIAIHLPIPEDSHSYLLVTVQKTPDYDDELITLPDYAPLKELLGTLRFARG
ncbi:MAG: hypothetical protein IJT29_03280 [Oscillospiraceae bacterium]|nr:hypothetical protein [Oscillospiraceae bacterium]